jgi:glycosyltransferase involved in cell wall biosynthesis
MKVLQIIYNLGPGGAERLTVDLANELARQGHDVTLCVLRNDKEGSFGFYKNEIAANVNYVNLNIPEGLRPGNIFILYKLIKKLKPDVVHCHLNLVNYLFPLTFLFPKINFFNTIHSLPSSEVRSSLEYRLRKYFYSRHKMKAVTISEEVTRFFMEYYKIPSYKEIYNGRAVPGQSEKFGEVKDFVQKFRDNGDAIILHIGTCNKAKNQRLLIGSFNRAVQNGKKAVLLIIGSKFDSEEGTWLKNAACDKVIFLGERHNVGDYLFNADSFCLSSEREGMPMSLIEALACGCVPVCTPVGGLKNVIIDGKTGYLSKSLSEDDYYLSLSTYLDNREKIKKEDLIQYYHDNFSIEECVKRYVELYKTL